jgi:hypothetical protein
LHFKNTIPAHFLCKMSFLHNPNFYRQEVFLHAKDAFRTEKRSTPAVKSCNPARVGMQLL